MVSINLVKNKSLFPLRNYLVSFTFYQKKIARYLMNGAVSITQHQFFEWQLGQSIKSSVKQDLK